MVNKLLGFTFFGGALGTVLRYALSLEFHQFYWLWIINILGALILGIVQTLGRLNNERAQAFWGTGFCGGFTTMSSLITFATLGSDPAFNWVALQIVVGIFAYWLGRVIGGAKLWNS